MSQPTGSEPQRRHRTTLRLPADLEELAAAHAERLHLSVNAVVVMALEHYLRPGRMPGQASLLGPVGDTGPRRRRKGTAQ